MPRARDLEPLFDDVVHRLRGRHFRALAASLRARVSAILTRWRTQSIIAMPGLDQFTIEQFEDSIAALLRTIADAMESDDPATLRRLIEQAPAHGADRIAQNYPIDAFLAEASILRSCIISELQQGLGRTLTDDESGALHQVIDLAFEHGTVEFMRLRSLHREKSMVRQVAGMRRLADLGTLVAGVAHDAANLVLPARMALERIDRHDLGQDARESVELVGELLQHIQHSIVNLRWLSVDSADRHRVIAPLNLHDFVTQFREFLVRMLPSTVSLEAKVPPDLPRVRTTSAALAQILLNLVRNTHEAMVRSQQRGHVLLLAEPGGDSRVDLFVEDDGPGMTPEALERCFEPFFTTKDGSQGGGLGLCVVHALVTGFGGTIEARSPALHLDAERGTAFVLRLPTA